MDAAFQARSENSPESAAGVSPPKNARLCDYPVQWGFTPEREILAGFRNQDFRLLSALGRPLFKKRAEGPYSVSTTALHSGSPDIHVELRASTAQNGSCGGGALTREE